MTRKQAGSVLEYLNRCLGTRAARADSDAELLQRFAGHRDEAAFAALVARHGDLVWSVCRRLLGHDQDAEDAFQATFVVLAARAASIRKRQSLASWLHGVAARTSWNARKSARRRRCREQRVEERRVASAASTAALHELQTILDEEVRRLPEKYQAPFVLCCLEGKGRAEAARQLGWKEGTLSSRLAQARERLHKRLARRGVALSAALCAGALSSDTVSASVPDALATTAARIAAGTVSDRVMILAKGVLQGMIAARLKAGAALMLLLGSLMAGGAAALPHTGTDQPAQPPRPPAAKPAEQRRTQSDLHGDPLPDGAVARLGTLRFRAGGGIHDLAFAPDGKTIASSSTDGTIWLWETASGKAIRRLPGRWLGSLPVAFHPEGKILAVGLTLHDVATGKVIRQMTLPRLDAAGGVTSVAFSRNGKLLASGHQDRTARLWDVATGKQLRKLDAARNNRVTCVAFSPDGKTLATGGLYEPNALRLWDVATGAERYAVRAHRYTVRGPSGEMISGGVQALAFAPDGKTLATTGGVDPIIRIWEAADGRELRQLRGHTVPPGSLAFSPDGKHLVSGGGSDMPGSPRNDTVRVWDVASGKEQYQLTKPQAWVVRVAFSPDGKSIATGAGDSSIALWDAATGKPLDKQATPRGTVQALAITADGKRIATRAEETILWDAAKATPLRRLPAGAGGIAFAPDGKLLASAESDGSVRLWQTDTGREQRRLHGHKGKVNGVAFAPDGKTLASGGADGTTRLWDLEDGHEIRQLIGRTPGLPPKPLAGSTMPPGAQSGGPGSVECLAFSHDGKLLAAGCSDNTVRIWDAAGGKQLHQLAEQGPVTAVAFSPDGRLLASAGGWDDKVRLWELPSGKLRLEIVGHDHRALALAFSPDGRILASSAWEQSCETYLWDTRTGKLWGRLGGHRGPVLSLAWSRDGTRLASGSTDTTVLLWDLSDRTAARSRQLLALSPRELEELWQQLDQRYAVAPEPTFSRAVWRLAAVPQQSVPFLAKRLRPKMLDEKKIPQWIADLENQQMAVIERAVDNLIELGDAAKPALREAQKKKHSTQGRELIEGLLEGVQRVPDGEEMRQLEAIEVLRIIDNDEARALLKKLAGGTPGAQLTQAAAAALKGVPRKRAGYR